MSSPFRSLTTDRKVPLPGFRAAERWLEDENLMAYHVKEYLARYPALLEEILLQDGCSQQFLEEIISKKLTRPVSEQTIQTQRRSAAAKTLRYSEIGVWELYTKLSLCENDTDICEKLYEMAQVLALTVNANSFHVYLTGSNGVDLSRYQPGKEPKYAGPAGKYLTVSSHVALVKKPVNVRDLPQESRFPKGVALGDESTHQVMAFPVLVSRERCYAVVEFTRGWSGDAFSNTEFETTTALFAWISACVQAMKRNKITRIQDILNRLLLQTTQDLFDDSSNLNSVESLITNILLYTKKLVSADRCTLFLVDKEKQELFADYFDEGKISEDGEPVLTRTSLIRFSQDRGIAGYVSQTAEVVNVKDAYKDERFNGEIDKQTGYHTKSILCMPIGGKSGVLAVVQMINRQDGDFFTGDDENAFKQFAVYLSLALHYSMVHKDLKRLRALNKISQEMVEFHLCCTDEETLALKANYRLTDDHVPASFYSYDFCAYDCTEILPQLFIKIIHESFGHKLFKLETLCRFTLSIRKNYRPVTYHNWTHGFHVAHSVWYMLKTNSSVEFTNLEKMALIFGAISHDIDHRGYSNDFFKKTEHPLAVLYSSSVMENHHYQQTLVILNSEDHDIFSFLSGDERKIVLEGIRKAILATDLALHFGYRKTMDNLIENREFNPAVPEHKNALTVLMMTGADLCAVSKPWDTMDRTMEYLYYEFWMQGDEEKKRGMEPLAMMDRLKKDDIPKQQIGFIDFICKPLYTTLSTVLPETKPLLDGSEQCKAHWEKIVTE